MMKKILIYLILALGFFCLGAIHKQSKVDRLILAVHDYVEVLDSTVDQKELSISDRNKYRAAKRNIDALYRDVKFNR